MNYKNLVFLGTSHIAKQSLEEVESYMKKEKPDIIALELDSKRLAALMSKKRKKADFRDIRHIGIKGFFFSLFGAWAEKKLGKLTGVAPGSEMKLAFNAAKKENIKVALIDQDIQITLKRLSQELTWKERLRFIADIAKAFFSRKSEIDFDLREVPDNKIIKKLVEKLKGRYPSLYKVLIEERNKVIAQNLLGLMGSAPEKKILVILGAGHVDDVVGLLKKSEENAGINYRFSVRL